MKILKEELLKINNELNCEKISKDEAFKKAASMCRLSTSLVREGHKEKFEEALKNRSFRALMDAFAS